MKLPTQWSRVFWEANSFSAGQEIPLISWNPKCHHRVHRSPSLALILSRMHPCHASLSCLRTCLILSSSYTNVFQVVSFLQVSPPKPCMHFTDIRATRPNRFIPPPFHHPNDIWQGVTSDLVLWSWLLRHRVARWGIAKVHRNIQSIAEARVRIHVRCAESGAGTGFSPSTSVFLC